MDLASTSGGDFGLETSSHKVADDNEDRIVATYPKAVAECHAFPSCLKLTFSPA